MNFMRIKYFGNNHIGLFMKTNNEITLIPPNAQKKFIDAVERILQTDVLKISVGGSDLLGIYVVMNNSGIILPNIVEEHELETIKKTGLNVYTSKTKYNANGNNLVVNDRGGVVSSFVPKQERKLIEDTLGIELIEGKVAGYSCVGSVVSATNKGFLSHYATNEEEMETLKDALKTGGLVGSINVGSGFINLGVIINKRGFFVGEATTGYEIGRIFEAFGGV